MLLIIGTIRLPAENVTAARDAMAAMATASRAEDGCIEYGYAEDVFVPGLIHIKERWQDGRHSMRISAHRISLTGGRHGRRWGSANGH